MLKELSCFKPDVFFSQPCLLPPLAAGEIKKENNIRLGKLYNKLKGREAPLLLLVFLSQRRTNTVTFA